MKDDITPEQFPIVSCIPLAVVLLPYLGELFGSCKPLISPVAHALCKRERLTQASGSPTTTYNPAATRKHPK